VLLSQDYRSRALGALAAIGVLITGVLVDGAVAPAAVRPAVVRHAPEAGKPPQPAHPTASRLPFRCDPVC
jgi:hypothetical protein